MVTGMKENPQTEVSNKRSAPFAYAHVTILEGEQGSGKSNTAVAKVVDAYDQDCVENYCRERLGMVCQCKSYSRKFKVAKIKHNGTVKLVRIPQNYKLHSSLQIHANFHFYGLPFYYYPNFNSLLGGLQSGRIRDGYLVIDEYYLGANARDSMTRLTRELAKQSFQFRKKRLEVIYVTPVAKTIDWIARYIPTERIICSYNERTRKVTLSIRKKNQKGTKEVTYDASRYWPNYWTEETINE